MAKFIKREVEEKEDAFYENLYYEVDDYSYFAMVDNQVRSEYALCEEYTLLPMVKKLYADNGISIEEKDLVHYPTEGYYYKTEGLRKFFQLVRNLQENPTVYNKVDRNAPEVGELIWLFGNTIWGTVASKRSETIFPRMKDILTHTLNSLQLKPLWTIDNIMKTIHSFATGNANLVELAYLTGDIRCLTAGAETNSLYREMSFCCSGCYIAPKKTITKRFYDWKVSEKVENLGDRLIDKYNEVLGRFQKVLANPDDKRISAIPRKGVFAYAGTRNEPKLLIKPKLDNHESMLSNQDLESPRVAMLGACLDDGTYYHWILDNDKVREQWANGVITTENYINRTGPEKADLSLWDMSAVKDKEGKINLNKLWSTESDKYAHPMIMAGIVQAGGEVIQWNDSKHKM